MKKLFTVLMLTWAVVGMAQTPKPEPKLTSTQTHYLGRIKNVEKLLAPIQKQLNEYTDKHKDTSELIKLKTTSKQNVDADKDRLKQYAGYIRNLKEQKAKHEAEIKSIQMTAGLDSNNKPKPR